MKSKTKIIIDDYYLKRSRGMGRFVKCMMELSDMTFPLKSNTSVPYPIWEQLFIYWRLIFVWNSIVVFPYNTAPLWAHFFIKPVLVVHDLMFLDENLFSVRFLSKPKSFISFLYRRIIFYCVYKKSHAIIFVISDVQNDFLKRFRYNGKTYVLNNTIVPELEKELLKVKQIDFEDKSKVVNFLCVTGSAPTKNTKFLFQGLMEYNKQSPKVNWKLSLIGLRREEVKTNLMLMSESVIKKIDLLELVSDKQLAKLYLNADFLLFPSKSEGFGVPLIEAMAANIKIISSNSSVMPTVCEDVAYYFSPYKISEFIEVIDTSIKFIAQPAKSRVHYQKNYCNYRFKENFEKIAEHLDGIN